MPALAGPAVVLTIALGMVQARQGCWYLHSAASCPRVRVQLMQAVHQSQALGIAVKHQQILAKRVAHWGLGNWSWARRRGRPAPGQATDSSPARRKWPNGGLPTSCNRRDISTRLMKAPSHHSGRQRRQDAATDRRPVSCTSSEWVRRLRTEAFHIERKDLGLLLQAARTGAACTMRVRSCSVASSRSSSPQGECARGSNGHTCRGSLPEASCLREQPAPQAGDVTRVFLAQGFNPVFHVSPTRRVIRLWIKLGRLLQPAQADGPAAP